jgi:hypothetical protein
MISKSISWSTWMTVRGCSRARSGQGQRALSSSSGRARRLFTERQQNHVHERLRARANVSQAQLTLLIPVGDLSRLPARVVGVLGDGLGVLLVMLAPLENLVDIKPRRRHGQLPARRDEDETRAGRNASVGEGEKLTFLRTLEETLGRGIGLSDSPTSVVEQSGGQDQL